MSLAPSSSFMEKSYFLSVPLINSDESFFGSPKVSEEAGALTRLSYRDLCNIDATDTPALSSPPAREPFPYLGLKRVKKLYANEALPRAPYYRSPSVGLCTYERQDAKHKEKFRKHSSIRPAACIWRTLQFALSHEFFVSIRPRELLGNTGLLFGVSINSISAVCILN
jgi:hypothetical protein